jgi:hypothetical protein
MSTQGFFVGPGEFGRQDVRRAVQRADAVRRREIAARRAGIASWGYATVSETELDR